MEKWYCKEWYIDITRPTRFAAKMVMRRGTKVTTEIKNVLRDEGEVTMAFIHRLINMWSSQDKVSDQPCISISQRPKNSDRL